MMDKQPSQTIPHLFLKQVKRFGNRVALREKDLGIWQEITWSQYRDHVRNFCLGLLELGLQVNDHVSILGENVQQWLYADLAVQSARGISVGVYPTNPAPEVKYVVDHSDSVFCVCHDQEQTDKILEVKEALPLLKKIIVMDMKGLRKYKDPLIISFEEVESIGQKAHQKNPSRFEALIDQVHSEDIALMVYTSGTTGPPKGAMLSHKNILSMVQSFSKSIPFYENDEIVSYLPLCHVAERVISVFVPMHIGITVNFAESVDTVTSAMCEVFPTIFFGVPRIWEKMHANVIIKLKDASWLKRKMYEWMMPIGEKYSEARLRQDKESFPLKLLNSIAWLCLFRALQKELGLRRVRIALSGAAPISPEILKYFHTLGVSILEGYGLTETTGLTNINPPGKSKIGTVGPVLSGTRVKIAEDGEIMAQCDHVFEGYFKDPAATAEVKQKGWLHTGDVGKIDEDGYLTITDRKKDIIITAGGKNISPSEIENRLKFSPYINEAIVIGDKRKFLSALIEIEQENVEKWAQENNITYTTYKSLAQNPDVFEKIKKEVQEVNKKFAQVETIKKFKLLEKELDLDDQEVTATMKVRRKAISEKFKDMIEEIYQ